MPNAKGAVLTDRDRALLTYVGIARYASAEQVHRLIAPGHSKKLVYRRLAKLCLPGGRIGQDACLRRLQYRRTEGTGVPVWALTPYGRSLVAPLVPWLPAPAAHDVGHRFLEHTLLQNDVLLWLVLALRRWRLRDSFQRVDEALQDAYDAIDRHQRAGRCRFDLDSFPVNELDLLRKLILKERPSESASTPARPGGA